MFVSLSIKHFQFITKMLLVCLFLCISVVSAVDDKGPLFLTPYIESGKFEQAKKLAHVSPLKGNVTSYSGFLTVDKQCGSNMFFWFFPAHEKVDKAPVVLWLQGGPGASSLFGLFSENGPYYLTPEGIIKTRTYSWTSTNSVLYIDNPVGTGYSFTSSENCYSQNQTHVGENLYKALQQFFTLFSELRPLPFYVTGESYAGKYVPAISYTIYKNNPTSNLQINLQGLAIGNGLVDPGNQFVYGDYLYQLGLIDDHGLKIFHEYEDLARQYIANESWYQAFECFDKLLNGDQFNGSTVLTNETGFTFYFNYLYNSQPPEGNLDAFIQKSTIRNQIHVGNSQWGNGITVEKHLTEDMVKSVRPWLEELLEHYKVLIYNGQLDIIVAYPLTVNYLKKMQWSGSAKYKTAQRSKWYVKKELAGYVKYADNLTEILVRNAGHMVPSDQPKWALDMITRFVENKKFEEVQYGR